MTKTDAAQCRTTGIWPTRSMAQFEPPPPRPGRPSRARRALKIAMGVIAVVVLFSAAGIAYMLAMRET